MGLTFRIWIVQLERTFKVQLPDYFRAHQKLHHTIEGIVQMPVENYQARGIKYFRRMAVVVYVQSHIKYFFLYNQTEPPLVQFCAVPMCPVFRYNRKRLAPSFPLPLPRDLQKAMR